MPSHTTMWMMAGGSALASACLTYVMTRPAMGSTIASASTAAAGLMRSGYEAARGLAQRPSKSFMAPEDHATSKPPAPIQNIAFEEYRRATLDRLGDDERAFQDFLDRLRHAKDRAEFDQFMAERKSAPAISSAG
jgi:hypothetical protein